MIQKNYANNTIMSGTDITRDPLLNLGRLSANQFGDHDVLYWDHMAHLSASIQTLNRCLPVVVPCRSPIPLMNTPPAAVVTCIALVKTGRLRCFYSGTRHQILVGIRDEENELMSLEVCAYRTTFDDARSMTMWEEEDKRVTDPQDRSMRVFVPNDISGFAEIIRLSDIIAVARQQRSTRLNTLMMATKQKDTSLSRFFQHELCEPHLLKVIKTMM